jgi:hypothetical protein
MQADKLDRPVRSFVRKLAWPAVFLCIAAVLVLANKSNIFAVNHEGTDLAANSLLILDAKSLDLWVGHYSRLGFSHPGPAILYVLAAGEALFHDLTGWVPSPFSGQLIAVAMYSALWICMLGAQFLRMSSSRFTASLSVLFFVLAIVLLDHHVLTGSLIPHLFVLPFAVAIMSFAGLAEGRADTLAPLAVSSGFLVHGNFAFVAVLGVLLLAALAYNFATRRADPARRVIGRHFAALHQRELLIGLGILAVFLLPLLVMTIKEFPGPIADYLTYGGGRAPNSVGSAVKYASVYWGGKAPMLIGLGACAVLWVGRRDDELSSSRHAVIAGILAATLALVLYARYGIDLLDHPYIGWFYYAAPALLLATMASMLLPTPKSKLAAGAWIVLGICMIAAIYHEAKRQPAYRDVYHDASGAELYRVLAERKTQGRIVLEVDRSQDYVHIWSVLLGAELRAKRDGKDPFCINEGWNISFTRRAKCTEAEVQSNPRFYLSKAKDAGESDFQVEGLWLTRFAAANLVNRGYVAVADHRGLFATTVLGTGWSIVEEKHVWTEGREATLHVPVPKDFAGCAITLDVDAFLPTERSVQEATVVLGDRVVAQASFTKGDNRKKLRIPLNPSLDGSTTLRIKVARPLIPGSWDPRKLGIGLHGIEVEGSSQVGSK